MLSICSSNLGKSSNARSFDTAFVDTSLDSEGTLVTPRSVPRVNDSPVRNVVFNTPTNHLDGMTTEFFTSVMNIDTAGVGKEIFVHGESDFNGSIGHDVGLDSRHRLGNRVSLGTLVDVLSVGGSVGGVGIARLNASGGSTVTRASRQGRVRAVVSAGGEGVSLAPVGGVVEITSDQTSFDVVVHGSHGVTTVATVTAGLATSEHVSSGESDVLTGVDAVSVGEGLDGTEGPA